MTSLILLTLTKSPSLTCDLNTRDFVPIFNTWPAESSVWRCHLVGPTGYLSHHQVVTFRGSLCLHYNVLHNNFLVVYPPDDISTLASSTASQIIIRQARLDLTRNCQIAMLTCNLAREYDVTETLLSMAHNKEMAEIIRDSKSLTLLGPTNSHISFAKQFDIQCVVTHQRRKAYQHLCAPPTARVVSDGGLQDAEILDFIVPVERDLLRAGLKIVGDAQKGLANPHLQELNQRLQGPKVYADRSWRELFSILLAYACH